MSVESRNLKPLLAEVQWSYMRASGAGGQHVNRTESAVELRWSLVNSHFFSDHDKSYLRNRLDSRLNQAGELIVRGQEHRSREQNRLEVMERFLTIISMALKKPKKRIATRPTRSSKVKKRQSKQLHSQKKALRSKPTD